MLGYQTTFPGSLNRYTLECFSSARVHGRLSNRCTMTNRINARISETLRFTVDSPPEAISIPNFNPSVSSRFFFCFFFFFLFLSTFAPPFSGFYRPVRQDAESARMGKYLDTRTDQTESVRRNSGRTSETFGRSSPFKRFNWSIVSSFLKRLFFSR